MAIRFGTECYLDLTEEEMNNGVKKLTICLNSLTKLGSMLYDVVILDECGLIRRHFLSNTCKKYVAAIYNQFVGLLRAAKFVVMCQDGVSERDIQFCTEVDAVSADDRTHVSCIRFVKPTRIHPIKWTTKKEDALYNMLECYKKSFKKADDNTNTWVCTRPFMVFCSQASYASYLVETLRAMAAVIEGADPNRIQGVWASIKDESKFCKEFIKDPETVAKQCDVLVCTSVVGAGFSIACHFYGFHAFLFNNILPFNEEQQFIRRLRYVITEIPMSAIRDSYIWVQKGCGVKSDRNIISDDFECMRTKVIMARVGLGCMELMRETQITCVAEKSESNAKHDVLWQEWGKGIESAFDPFAEPCEASTKGSEKLQKHFTEWVKQRKTHISDLVLSKLNKSEDCDGLTEQEDVIALEISSAMELHRKTTANHQVKTFKEAFNDEQLGKNLLKHYCTDKQFKSVTGNESSLCSVIGLVMNLGLWLEWVYKDVSSDSTATYWTHVMRNKKYQSQEMYRRFAFFALMDRVVMDLLCPVHEDTPVLPSYLMSAGTTPFFTGLRLLKVSSLCDALKERLVWNEDDDDEKTKSKKELCACVNTFKMEHTVDSIAVEQITNCPEAAHKFISVLLKKAGLNFQGSGGKCTMNAGAFGLCRLKGCKKCLKKNQMVQNKQSCRFQYFEVRNLKEELSLLLALKPGHDALRSIFTKIGYSDNFSDDDRAMVIEAGVLYTNEADELGLEGVDFSFHRHMMGDIGFHFPNVHPRRQRESREEEELGDRRVRQRLEHLPFQRLDVLAKAGEIVRREQEREHERLLELAAVQDEPDESEHDSDSDDDSDSDGGEEIDVSANAFVDDMAGDG